jgi:beta-lactam-binding protein with PASTA domain
MRVSDGNEIYQFSDFNLLFMFRFITKRPLWINLLAGLILAVGLLFLFILSLKWITHHGQSRIVPEVVGKSFDEASRLLSDMGFDVEIQDSVYVDTAKALTVLKQFPESDAQVKVNRRVFLTISRAVPPEVEMPNLVGYSLRSAEVVLKNMGLQIGDTTFKPDFARYAVLEQSVPPGTKLPMGSRINLVLGDGLGRQDFAVPNFMGLTLSEAKTKLESYGLIQGTIIAIGAVTDTAQAYIWRQNPGRYDETGKPLRIRAGQMVDFWIKADKPAASDSLHLPLPD